MRAFFNVAALVYFLGCVCELNPDTISKPGLYMLNYNVTNPAGVAFTITTSNVTLDLNNYMISGAGGGTDGIVTTTGMTNITIKNGTITTMRNTGIFIHPGCSNVTLSNIRTTACSFAGFQMGTFSASAGTIMNNIMLNNCSVDNSTAISGCFVNTASTVGINNLQVTRNRTTNNVVSVLNSYDIQINNLGAISNTVIPGSVLGITTGTNIVVQNSLMQTNSMSFALLVVSSTNIVLDNIMVANNLKISSDANDFFSIILSNNAVVRNCQVINNTLISTTTNFFPEIMHFNVNNFVAQDCLIANNAISYSTSVGSSLLVGYATDFSSKGVFVNCQAYNNSSTQQVAGFGVDVNGTFTATFPNASYLVHCINCAAVSNSAQGVGAYGFVDNTITTSCLWYNCLAAYNNANTNANSFGIADIGRTNAFVRDVAVRNGPAGGTAANQLSGVSATSKQASTITTLNGFNYEYSNQGIV